MTDTLHKNPESSTVSDTPETNQCVKNNKHLRFLEEDHCSINGKFTFTNPVVNLCKKLERERDEAKRYADTLAELLPVGMLPKDIENIRDANYQMAQDIYKLERERNEWKSAAVAFEKERDAYENALIKIERIAYSDNDVYHDIEQIEAIAHNALNL